MSKELNSRYSNIYRFLDAFKGFEKFYTENEGSGIDFSQFLLKLNIFDNFITSVIEKIDLESGIDLNKKLDSDSDFMLKAILEKLNKTETKNDFFLTKNKSLIQISESSEETSSDDNDNHSSISSISDINSKDSDSDNEDSISQKELSTQTNKMMAYSLVELKIRKKTREFETEKIEEE